MLIVKSFGAYNFRRLRYINWNSNCILLLCLIFWSFDFVQHFETSSETWHPKLEETIILRQLWHSHELCYVNCKWPIIFHFNVTTPNTTTDATMGSPGQWPPKSFINKIAFQYDPKIGHRSQIIFQHDSYLKKQQQCKIAPLLLGWKR